MVCRNVLLLFIVCYFSTHVVCAKNSKDVKIFKCTNDKGSIFYNDKPCPKNNKEEKIKAIKAPINTTKNQSSYYFVKKKDPVENYVSFEEKFSVQAIESQFDKGGHKSTFLKKNNEKKSRHSKIGKSLVSKEKLASMTGAQRENHFEKIEIEQLRILREANKKQNAD